MMLALRSGVEDSMNLGNSKFEEVEGADHFHLRIQT